MPSLEIQSVALIFLFIFLIMSYYQHCKNEKFAIEEKKEQRFKNIGATYRMTFSTNWDPNHPESGLRVFFRDPGPQFGPLIGVTHQNQIRFWSPGQYATSGVYNYLKSGNTAPFEKEATIQTQISEAEFLIKSDGLVIPETKEDENKTQTVSTTFRITKEFPLVSILTRMVPSPDYFLGVAGKSLLDGDGEFIENVSVPLILYDAGYNKRAFTQQEKLKSHTLKPMDVIKPVLIGNQRKYLHHNGILRFEKIG